MESSPQHKPNLNALLNIPEQSEKPYSELQSALDAEMRKNRAGLWEAGALEDIRLGNYFVEYGGMDLSECDMVGEYALNGKKDSAGLAYGLEKNILIETGRAPILVADRHNFAAPFIVEAFRAGKIEKGSVMDHFDHHSDLGGGENNPFADYRPETMSEKEKLEFLLNNTAIGTWQTHPLLESGIADRNAWRWLALSAEGNWVQKNEKEEISPETPRFDRSSDILDIDLDFLRPADDLLSDEEKAGVLGGVIPPRIAQKLDDTLKLAKSAKIITMATSPTFINQPRAIVYAKYFVEKYRSPRD